MPLEDKGLWVKCKLPQLTASAKCQKQTTRGLVIMSANDLTRRN
jgi:hypothetical protein